MTTDPGGDDDWHLPTPPPGSDVMHYAGTVVGGPQPIPVCCCDAHVGAATCPGCPRHGRPPVSPGVTETVV